LCWETGATTTIIIGELINASRKAIKAGIDAALAGRDNVCINNLKASWAGMFDA